jgi:hypothetical protein
VGVHCSNAGSIDLWIATGIVSSRGVVTATEGFSLSPATAADQDPSVIQDRLDNEVGPIPYQGPIDAHCFLRRFDLR